MLIFRTVGSNESASRNVIVHRGPRRTALGLAEAKVRRHAHHHGLHQDPADVLHQSQRHHGRAGGAQARDLAP